MDSLAASILVWPVPSPAAIEPEESRIRSAFLGATVLGGSASAGNAEEGGIALEVELPARKIPSDEPGITEAERAEAPR